MPERTPPRVIPLPKSDWNEVHRDLLTSFGGLSHLDELFATLLHAPGMVEAVLPMSRYINEGSTLSPSHRLLLGLRTGWLERSEVIWTSYAARVPVEDGETMMAWPNDGDGADRVRRSLVELVDELVLTASVSDSTWASLARGHSIAWLMDAVETVAHVSFLCCLAHSFGVVAADAEVVSPRRALPGLTNRPTVAPAQLPLGAARITPVPGKKIAVLRTFERHPKMTAARRHRADYVNMVSPLTPHDRETLILRMGWNCRSEYEWAKHVGSVGHAREHGVDPALVAAGPTSPDVSDHDAVLMRVADELHKNSVVSDHTWAAVVQLYDLPVAMSTVFTASSYRSTSMSLNVYGVQLEPGDERFPQSPDE